ncbi:MAG TPA: CRISPR-associated protein Csx11, partial [Anaerolineae bacterium]|nr:CRISPR-associated protein Csx11 [Anaerolineae bacterium]
MSYGLQVLADNRDALLLAEVAAWLHMLGKFHEDFLQGQHDLDIQIPSDLATSHPRLHNLLTDPWPGPIWSQLPVPELDAASLSIFDLIKDHRNRNAKTGLARLMWDAHGRGSGTEKGVLERFASGQQNVVYPSTAFGFEHRPIALQR